MTYDLLIKPNNSENYYSYERLDTQSLAFSISRKLINDNHSFVFIREATSIRTDTWRYFDCEAATYSDLHKVDDVMNFYLNYQF